jgi:hypothetical protein
MAYQTNSLITRIVWCRQQRTQARGHRESLEWHAEEDGLRDALLNQDHSKQYRYSLPRIYSRYLTGLQDGRDLLRMDVVGIHFRSPDRQ